MSEMIPVRMLCCLAPNTSTSDPSWSIRAAHFSSMVGSKWSSESRKDRYSPLACWMPLLRAAPALVLGWVSTFTRASRFSYSRRMSRERSVEPSSTQMTSMLFRVCPNILSRQGPRYFSTLYTGIITETLGSISFFSIPFLHHMMCQGQALTYCSKIPQTVSRAKRYLFSRCIRHADRQCHVPASISP